MLGCGRPELVLKVGTWKSQSLDLRFQGPWGVGQISVGFRPEDRRPAVKSFSQIAEGGMSETSLKLDDVLSAVTFALFTFRNHHHPTALLLFESCFLKKTDRSLISGIRRCRQLL